MAGSWWRIDSTHPAAWHWQPFAQPRHRFDPLSGAFRVRYAANRAAVAARERFPARALTEPDGQLWLVELVSFPPALYLTHQRTLDALGLDDRVSTGRIHAARLTDLDTLLDTCGRLADAVHEWWHDEPPPIVYRSRTVPGGRNVAFTRSALPRVVAARRLRDATALHAYLVLRAGFVLPEAWLAATESE